MKHHQPVNIFEIDDNRATWMGVPTPNNHSTMADDPETACPVDHKTRDAWLAQARASQSSSSQTSCPVDHANVSPSSPRSWTDTIRSYLPGASSSPSKPFQIHVEPPSRPSLRTEREISTIPRSSSLSSCPVPHGASANAETAAEHDSSGNWVYPSEKMFFDAMRRKGHDARETDMKTVVPIHNAVNERAWKEVRQWEAPYLSASQ